MCGLGYAYHGLSRSSGRGLSEISRTSQGSEPKRLRMFGGGKMYVLLEWFAVMLK